MSKLVIISGVSGAGKDSVIQKLKEKHNLEWVITSTSRPMRPGESEGNPYHFLTKEEFLKRIEAGSFTEWSINYDFYYGTQAADLEKSLNKNSNVTVLKTDYKGVASMREIHPEAIVIFIVAPSIEVLEQRLVNRGQDSAEVIVRRLEEVKIEMEAVKGWSGVHLIINKEGQLEEAAEEIWQIIKKIK